MKSTAASTLTLSLFCLVLAAAPAHATGGPTLESMATCQDSWLYWKDTPALSERFAEMLRAGFTAKDGGYLVPKAKASLFGLAVARVYPESVGMGVGFSVAVTGDFDVSRKAVEKAIGKTLACEPDNDELRACEARVGPKKNIMVATDPGETKTTLIGCFYFYEK